MQLKLFETGILYAVAGVAGVRGAAVGEAVEWFGNRLPTLSRSDAGDVEVVIVFGRAAGIGGTGAIVVDVDRAKRGGGVVGQHAIADFPLGQTGIEVVDRIVDADAASNVVEAVAVIDVERDAGGRLVTAPGEVEITPGETAVPVFGIRGIVVLVERSDGVGGESGSGRGEKAEQQEGGCIARSAHEN